MQNWVRKALGVLPSYRNFGGHTLNKLRYDTVEMLVVILSSFVEYTEPNDVCKIEH